ncbi:MAG: NrpR regulatory domain-containing protein, partial [Lentisphaeria bacterium]
MSIIHVEPKQKVAILRVLRDAGAAVSSAEIAREIQANGFNLSPRTVRLYLQRLEEEGLVKHAKRGRSGGRCISRKGIEEIADAGALDRLGFTAAKVDRLAWEMDYSVTNRKGCVVLNITLIDAANLPHACREMTAVFRAGLGMGERVALVPAGDQIGDIVVPSKKVAIGTVCSVTVNGVLLNHRVNAASRFGAVLELQGGVPTRFTDLISYDGSTLDPLEIFIRARLTEVHNAAVLGNGRIGVSFREIPTPAVKVLREVRHELDEAGLGSILLVGKPNQPLLDFPVREGRTGFVV